MDLIDRDELELDTEWSEYYDGYMSYSQSQINGAVEVQAIPIPDNATNGDMIRAMFGGMELNESGNMVYIEKLYFGFPRGWWNAPYKEE